MTRLNCEYSRGHDVQVEPGFLGRRANDIPEMHGRRALVVTTPTVHRLHGRSLSTWLASSGLETADVLVLPLTEATKTMDSALAVCGEAIRLELGRTDLVIAFGGGVCSDVVSFSAGLIRRGIPSINIPTTLVGQIDAAIGVKNAVNHGRKKNYLGSFRAPARVLVDPHLLSTQPTHGLRCGLAEIIKMAVIRDRALFGLLQSELPTLLRTAFQRPVAVTVIGRAIDLMLAELAGNPLEDKTYERLVDFGHTVSPLIEERSGYTIAHGDAVAMDIALCAVLARDIGLLPSDDSIAIVRLLRSAGLPLVCDLVTPDLVAAAFRAAVGHRSGRLNLVLPIEVGAATFVRDSDDVPASLVSRAIAELHSYSVAESVAAGLGVPVLERPVLDGDVHDDHSQPIRARVGQRVRAAGAIDHDITRPDAEGRAVDGHLPVAIDHDVDLFVLGPVPMFADAGVGRHLDEIDELQRTGSGLLQHSAGSDQAVPVVRTDGVEVGVAECEPAGTHQSFPSVTVMVGDRDRNPTA